MKTKTSWLLLIPLSIACVVIGRAVLAPPDAARHTGTESPDSFGSPATSVEADSAPVDRGEPVPDHVLAQGRDQPVARLLLLETVLLDGDLSARLAAIEELRALADDGAVQALAIALGDDDGRVRDAALAALSELGSEEAIAAIASLGQSDRPQSRGDAAEALAATDNSYALDYLELLIGDDDPRVRMIAIESLGDIRDDRAVNIISRALRDPDPEVRAQAEEILDEFSDETLFHSLNPRR